MKVSEFVRQVKDVEGFDIDVSYRSDKKVDSTYGYSRKAMNKMTVSQWCKQRLPEDLADTCIVLKADGSSVHGRTQLSTVRNSYL